VNIDNPEAGDNNMPDADKSLKSLPAKLSELLTSDSGAKLKTVREGIWTDTMLIIF